MRRLSLPLPAFALTFTCSLIACTGDDDGPPGTDGGPPPGAPRTMITVAPDVNTRETAARFEFTSNLEDSTFTCALDERAAAPCTSPYELVLIDGAHHFSVFATNAYGIADATPETHDWTIDTVAPVAVVIQGPFAIDNSEYPNFFFTTGDTLGGTYTCRIDEDTAVPCTSPWWPTLPVSKGPHSFELIATDLAGNVQVVPTRYSWTADLTLPDTTIDSGPSGPVTTREATFTFSSRNAAAPVRYACRLDGTQSWDPWMPCTSPVTYTNLVDGTHRFEVQVIDAGNASDPTPALHLWSIDASPPTVEIFSGPTPETSDTTPSFYFSYSSDAVERECRMISSTAPDPAFVSCTSPYTAAALPPGQARFEVRVRDAQGNTATVGQNVVIDTTAPTVTITSTPPALGNDNTPTFEFVTQGATVTRCKASSQVFSNCTSPYTPPVVLADGSYTFEVRAYDAANNLSAASFSFAVDTTAPTINFINGPLSSNGPTADSTPTFTFNVGGAAAAGVTCRLGSTAFAPCASPYTLASTPDGNHVLFVRAVDAVGNERTVSRGFNINTVPLSITFTGGPTGLATRDRSPAFTWTTTGAVRTTECRHDAGAFGTCFNVMLTELSDGPHTLEVAIADDIAHSLSATVSFTVDTVAPTATFTAGPSGTISTTDVSFSFDTAGAPVVTECRLFRQGEASGAYVPCASPFAMTLQPPSSPYPYSFEVRVSDAAGNQWSAYRNFTYAAP